jgi:lipase chaperone LimK
MEDDLEDDSAEIKFKADDKGRMVADERARLNLEKLFALYTPAERQKELDKLQATLPPAAARDLADMMERYINYDSAQRQTFPPGGDLASPEDGLNVIDGMHNLRVQYFGADAANSMFGKEEKIQRELLRLMSLEKDGSLTIEEKAERAQAMYQSQMPETAADLAAGRKQAERVEATRQKQVPPKTN